MKINLIDLIVKRKYINKKIKNYKIKQFTT